MPDLHALHLARVDHTASTITPAVLGFVAHDALRSLTERHPGLAMALWRETLIDASIAREWMVSHACRSALNKVAHLFCELAIRLRAAGLASNDRYPMPL